MDTIVKFPRQVPLPGTPGRGRNILKYLLAMLVMPALGGTAGCDEKAEIIAAGEGYTFQALTLGKRDYQARVPDGYVLEYLAGGMGKPRVLHFSGERLFAGSRSGTVYWLDPPYRKARELVSLDGYPHSVVVRDGYLYVARTRGVYRAPYHEGVNSLQPSDFEKVLSLPGGGGHSSRTLKSGPDGNLYLAIGISGNCSDEYLSPDYPPSKQRGGILRLNQEDGRFTAAAHATGLRNPVGFAWQPGSDDLYASNNGPDHLGYEQPPEYFSKVTPGSFHGMPWFQFDGKQVFRDRCVNSVPPQPLQAVVPPVATFPARNAPMDVAFYPLDDPDPGLAGDAVVALHGSWAVNEEGGNSGGPETRRHPALVRVDFDNGAVVGVVDLVSGFQLDDGERWARPMGVAFGPDGALYFSSDARFEGLYRLRRIAAD